MVARNGSLFPCLACGALKYRSISRAIRRSGRHFCNRACFSAWRAKQESTAIDRFWAKVNKTEACWLWTAAILKSGYGAFDSGTGRKGHRVEYAHRFAMKLAGFDLKRAEGHHQCPNKHCVRLHPDHVQVVPRQHNPDSPSHINRLKTHCIRGHLLSAYTPGKMRRCKICAQLRKKQRLSSGES